jgi:hypothetical protein
MKKVIKAMASSPKPTAHKIIGIVNFDSPDSIAYDFLLRIRKPISMPTFLLISHRKKKVFWEDTLIEYSVLL